MDQVSQLEPDSPTLLENSVVGEKWIATTKCQRNNWWIEAKRLGMEIKTRQFKRGQPYPVTIERIK